MVLLRAYSADVAYDKEVLWYPQGFAQLEGKIFPVPILFQIDTVANDSEGLRTEKIPPCVLAAGEPVGQVAFARRNKRSITHPMPENVRTVVQVAMQYADGEPHNAPRPSIHGKPR